jgi:IclR family acetate operon transcriptional repressor
MSLNEISRSVGLPKSTAFKYLHTLQRAGFVMHRKDGDSYELGTRFWELSQLAGVDRRLREISLPIMRDLRDLYNETVNLGTLDGQEVLYLEMVESRHALSMRARVGGRDPAYSTSLGKAC